MSALFHAPPEGVMSIVGDYPPRNKRIIIGVVAPSLESSGGVQTIVEMLVRQIELSENYECLLVSLATASIDDCSSRILKPATWLTRPIVKNLIWRGRNVVHVGCSFAELEFMRYRQRTNLKMILSKCDVIQIVGGFPAWGASVLDCDKPVSVWCATRCIWERRRILAESKGVIGLWFYWMTRVIDCLDDFVIKGAGSLMVMNALMGDYAAKLRKNKYEITWAPPGVDASWFIPCPERLSRSECGERPYILSVGRFGDPRKNPDLLLEAYILLTKKFSVFPRLIFSGDTSPSKYFWKRVSDCDLIEHVTFCEKPDNEKLRKLYQHALCLALTSDEEGFGMVLVEAMACGVPVIATRCGGPNGIVSDKVDGYLVDIGDVEALVESLCCLCFDLDRNQLMGSKAREKVEIAFTDQAASKVFFDCWDKLLAQSNEK